MTVIICYMTIWTLINDIKTTILALSQVLSIISLQSCSLILFTAGLYKVYYNNELSQSESSLTLVLTLCHCHCHDHQVTTLDITNTISRLKHSKWTGRPSRGSTPERTSTTRRVGWRAGWGQLEPLRSEGKGPGAPMVTGLRLRWTPATARWGWQPVPSLAGGCQQRYHPVEPSRGEERREDHYYITFTPLFTSITHR